jgi:hypothetical protein
MLSLRITTVTHYHLTIKNSVFVTIICNANDEAREDITPIYGVCLCIILFLNMMLRWLINK